MISPFIDAQRIQQFWTNCRYPELISFSDSTLRLSQSPNGRELFYRSGRKMMAVDIAMQPGFVAGKPRMLFVGDYVPTPLLFPNYDVSSDGQRFLMFKPSEQEAAAPTQINVVLKWFEELKRRVPQGNKP